MPGHCWWSPGDAVTPLKFRRLAVIWQGTSVDHGFQAELDIAQVSAYVPNLAVPVPLADAPPSDVVAQPDQTPVAGADTIVSYGEQICLHALTNRLDY